MASPDGACACLRRRSSNCTLSSVPATTRSAGRLKKQSQTASAAAMGDSARRQRGLCRRHGRCSGGLSQTARSRAPPRVPRRKLEAVDHRDAHADPRQTRTTQASCEYERNGVANLFMMFAPLEGWRYVKVTDRHTAIDYAEVLRELSDVHFPDAAKIVLVQDNLNTHKPASLYEAFPATEARRLVERFEWHYTPKHGSWLDMAESELGVLASQCLDRRIADQKILAHQVDAWQDYRNRHHAKANWQFTTADARVKLKRLYPQFE